MALNLRDLFRKASPEERAEIAREVVDLPAIVAKVREELANPTQPARPVMDPAERTSLGREYRSRQKALLSAREDHATRIADLETRRAEISRQLEQLYASGPDGRGFTAWRDEVWARLWSERPPLVDVLIGQALAEAEALRAEGRELPTAAARPSSLFPTARDIGELITPEMERDTSGLSRRVSNGASVAARRAALLQLAENVRSWTMQGSYSSEADLGRMFNEAYGALPQVEAVDDVVRRFAKPARPAVA